MGEITMKKPAKLLITFILPSALIFGALFLSGCGPDQNGRVIEATGTVEMTEITVSTKVGGAVVRVQADEGRELQKDDLLAELDHDQLDAQITAARANLEVARLRYQKTSDALSLSQGDHANPGQGTRETQIKISQNNLDVAAANLDSAETDFKRTEQLYRDQLISQSQYDQALTRKKVASAQYEAAKNQLDLAKSSPNADDIDLTNKQSAAQIKQAEANLTLLETQLKDVKIYAPVAGTLSARMVEMGEIVTPGMPLFVILDYAKPWVKIYLPLPEMERVTLNQKATITMDADPKKEYPGRVSFISQEAEFTPKNYQTKEERIKQVYAIKIELDNSSKVFKAGMPVDVRIDEGQK
jgi:HlyD family secretion protein